MVKRLLFLTIALVFLQISDVFSQITIGTVDAGPYTPGSSIAATFSLDPATCIRPGNRFDLYLVRPDGTEIPTPIGSYNGFYSTFVNGIIPGATIAPPLPGYRLRIKTTNPVLPVGPDSNPFEIRVGTVANPILNSLSKISETPRTFGICEADDNTPNDFEFTNESSVGNVVATITNTNTPATSTTLTFTTTGSASYKNFTAEKTHYTILAKATMPDGSIGTKAYFLINNKVITAFETAGGITVCYPTGKFEYTVGPNIKLNFPGNIYKIDWGDGNPPNEYTYCDIFNGNFLVSHLFERSSCGLSYMSGTQTFYNAFAVNVGVVSPFCNDIGRPLSSPARVITRPINSFDGPEVACLGNVTFTNTSVAGDNPNTNAPGCTPSTMRYSWFVNGVPAGTDKNLIYNFTATGEYIIRLVSNSVGSSCQADPVERRICIQAAPQPSFTLPANKICLTPGTLTPVNTSNPNNTCARATVNYTWVVNGPANVDYLGGTNASSPAPQFKFRTPGVYDISLTVQSATCSETTATQRVVVNGPPTATMSPNISLCNIGNYTFDPTATNTRTVVGGTIGDEPTGTYEWAVTGGNYTFVSPYDKNSKYPVINFAEYKEYTITLTHTNSCSPPATATQKITFIQAPVPTISVPSTTICYDGTVQLTGNITNDAGTTFTWSSTNAGTFSPPNNLITTFTPSNVNPLGEDITIQLLVNTGLSGNCAQVPATQVIKILPRNTGSALPMSICSENNVTYTPTSSVSGSTFTWTAALTSGTATFNASGAGPIDEKIINTNTTTSAVVTYTITPRSNNCDGIPYQLVVTVNPRPILIATPAAPTICSGQGSAITLSVTNTPGPTTYTWTSVATNDPNNTVTGNLNSLTPTTVTTIDHTLINNGTAQGTVTYTITPHSSSGCPGNPVTITINVDPAVTASIAGPAASICNTGTYTLGGNQPKSNETGTWTWVPGSGQSGVMIQNQNSPNAVATGLVAGQQYVFTWTISAPGVCNSSSSSVTITVNEPTVPGTTTGTPTTVCSGTNSGTITLSGNLGSVIRWEYSLDGTTNWTAVAGTNTGTTYTFSNLSTTTYYRAIVQNGQCNDMPSTATMITVSPASTIAAAGPDQVLCDEKTTMLAGNTPDPAKNETGLWSIPAGAPSAFITTPTDPSTTVSNLIAGQTYRFVWTITGTGACGPTTDTVIVTNNPPINQSITSTSVVVCNGQDVILTSVAAPTGGGGTYAYQWESQVNGGAWLPQLSDGNEETLTITLNTEGTVNFRRIVTSGGCTDTSNVYPITVRPAITGNSITADQIICNGSTPVALTGLVPTGGDGSFTYQWQSSPDNVTWTNISATNSPVYQPPALTAVTFYRRGASTAACGSTFIYSNSVKITVNPNAHAEFTWTHDIDCFPFSLPITVVEHPERNGIYTWYANNVQIGTGATFPGYAINASNQSVTIKLVVTSSFGCASDSLQHVFSTNQAVPASFTLSTSSNCGPVSTNFVNTSNLNAGATFRWNFGNGQTSNETNPSTITFQPDASGKDTTYVVTLYSITSCGTDSAKVNILVKSPPRPVFSPSATNVCSPTPITFTNNSPLQAGVTYTFNFGDGTQETTNDRSPVIHIYPIRTTVQTYYATLTAVNECNTVTTTPYTIIVRPNTVNAELVVNDGNQLVGCAPHTVTFDNNTTGATSYIIDFNDGTQPRQSIISPERFQYTFTNPGTYKVLLTATNGCSTDTTSETIVVRAQPLTDFDAVNKLGCTGLAVKFTNNTQNGVSYLWDFGDGSPTSSEFEPTHIYTGSQEYYTVTLTAVNNLGCPMTVTKTNFIHIVQPPVAAFNVNPSTVISIPDYTFNFEDQSTNTPTIWEWDFGDGTTSALRNPSHTYLDTGTYRVTLKTINQQGCFTTTFKNVTIKGVPGYLFVPNSFIPGDTRPELREFRAKGSGIANWRFSIFNKWGQLLWETTKLEEGRPAEGWDGTFKGQPMPQGVYFWKIDVQMINGAEWKGMTYDKSPPKRTGPIHLIR